MDWVIFLWVWSVTMPLMLGLWLIYRLHHRNAALADFGFCVGLALVSVSLGLVQIGDVWHRTVVAAMGAIYALRLGVYIFHARVMKDIEDPRYQLIRKKIGGKAEWWVFLYFLGQALAIAIFSVPLMVLMVNPRDTWSIWEFSGACVWMVGIVGETLADYQLQCFRQRSTNKGKTCREGLWGYSRHPNYFFEGVHWCAYVVMSVGIANAWLTFVGPVLMIVALTKVSGIPFSEIQALATRGDDYREYQRTTSAFIPWFRKKRS